MMVVLAKPATRPSMCIYPRWLPKHRGGRGEQEGASHLNSPMNASDPVFSGGDRAIFTA